MMRGLRHQLWIAALLAVGLARLAEAAAVPVRLVSPGRGAVLEAGSTAILEWMPDACLAEEDWEEWEAFLSLDGGATYPIRLTPHLERDLREIRFKVPDLPTRRARLLLRVGDERRERVFELPQRFAIALPPPSAVPERSLDLRRRAVHRGEPARPGEPGVVAWVEGARNGGGSVEVVAAEPPRTMPGLTIPAEEPDLTAVAVEAPPSGVPAVAAATRPASAPSGSGVAAGARTLLLRSAPILLLIQRQNE